MTTAMQVRDRHPNGELKSLRHDARDLFDRFIGDLGYPWSEQNGVPLMDLIERDDSVEITTDVPGFTPDQLDVEVVDNVITISGESEFESEKKGDRTHLSERRRDSFQRSITLPCHVVDDAVEASLENGVLTVTLPKAETAPRRKVPVKG